VFVGRTQGDLTCVSYQSPLAKKADLGGRLAAQRGTDACRPDAVAEDIRIGSAPGAIPAAASKSRAAMAASCTLKAQWLFRPEGDRIVPGRNLRAEPAVMKIASG
jgi:hypothetical protein